MIRIKRKYGLLPGRLSRRVGGRCLASLERRQMALESLQQWAGRLGQVRYIALVDAHILGHFEKLAHLVHAHQETLVQIQCILALLFVHIEVFLQQIDDAVVVAGEQTDQVAEQQHEAHVDDTCEQQNKRK